MVVCTEKIRAFHTDGPVAKSCTLSRTGNYAYMLRHGDILRAHRGGLNLSHFGSEARFGACQKFCHIVAAPVP